VPLAQQYAKELNKPGFGLYKDNGELETDAEKIAASMKISRGDGSSTDSDLPVLSYNNPKSKLKYKSEAYRMWPDGPKGYFLAKDAEEGGDLYERGDYKNRLHTSHTINGIKSPKEEGYDKEHNYRIVGDVISGIPATDGEAVHSLHASQYTEDYLRNTMALEVAKHIAKRHQILNDRAKGGSTAASAGFVDSKTGDNTCKFCGAGGLNNEEFKVDHQISSNGWCKAALDAHNSVHPIKVPFEGIE
jgi:hypothetical protein